MSLIFRLALRARRQDGAAQQRRPYLDR